MKHFFSLLSFLYSLSINAQQMQLPSVWKFHIGDSLQWHSPSYDDSSWEDISIGMSWHINGVNHKGVAWYRLTFILKDNIKRQVEAYGSLLLNLAWINDVDLTYFNGQFIGGRGGMPPEYFKGASFRQYEIPLDMVKWNEENTIAVKVFSEHNTKSGIMEGPFWIGAPTQVIWPSEIPKDCPFERSKDIESIVLTGKYSKYTWADTFYPTWADNGLMYSGYTDGNVRGVASWSNNRAEAVTGQAVIKGDHPMQLSVEALGVSKGSALPSIGRYPSAHLTKDGVIYIGTYLLDDASNNAEDDLIFDIVGPFVGFRYSEDYGKTWVDCPLDGYNPLFDEENSEDYKVKFGAPHVVDFGKDMEHSPDGKAYMIAHGSSADDANPRFPNSGWSNGDQVYLCRMEVSIDQINDINAYEFYAGENKNGAPVWTKDIRASKPLLEWNNNMGIVTMTYHPELKKYIMCITDGVNGMGTMNTYFLEADSMFGEWRIIAYWKDFGPQAYFVNIPSKFIGQNNTMWICYSANWWAKPLRYLPNPYGSQYGMSLQEIKFVLKK